MNSVLTDVAKPAAYPTQSRATKPLGADNEHPCYATEFNGQQHVSDLLSAVQNGRYWNDTAIIITCDEHGGRWDHVASPVIDRWDPAAVCRAS